MAILSPLRQAALAVTVIAIPSGSIHADTTVFHGSQSTETVKIVGVPVPKDKNVPPATVLRGGDGAEMHVVPGHPMPEVTRLRKPLRHHSR